MKQYIPLGLACLLIGGGIGYGLGHGFGDSAKSKQEKSTKTEARVRPSAATATDAPSRDRSRVSSISEAFQKNTQLGRMQSLIDLYANMGEGELEMALEELDRLDVGDRMLASLLLFSRWAELDPQRAIARTNAMGFAGGFAKMAVLRDWAMSDPVNAAKYFTDNPDEFARVGRGFRGGEGGAATIAKAWAAMDPDAAMAWANTLEGRDKSQAMVAVVEGLAGNDPQRAIAVATTLTGDDQVRAYEQIAAQWASNDFGKTDAWISTLSGEAKDKALAAALPILARTDPEAATTRAAAMAAGPDRDAAIRSVAEFNSRENPATTVAYVLESNPENLTRTLQPAMANYVRTDEAGAKAMISQQPIGPERDVMTQSLLRISNDGDHQERIAFAESISNNQQKSRTVGSEVRRWMQTDEAAARAYVESTDAISDRAKQWLLNSGNNSGQRRGSGNWQRGNRR